MLRKHIGGQIYDTDWKENDLKILCLDVKVLGVNRYLYLITVIVKEIIEHMMYHMVYTDQPQH